jgi:hypothetical protein
MLSGNQETPAVTTAATGNGTFTLSGFDGGAYTLTWNVTYTGLTPNAGHIHTGWAAESGGVTFNFGNTLTSPIMGSAAVTAAQAQSLATGHTYANLHSAAHANGEIRGQILKQGQELWTALPIDGANEVPPVTTAATATFGAIVDPAAGTVAYEGTVTGANGTMAHIHFGGPGGSGGVAQALDLIGTGNNQTFDGGFAIGAFPNQGDGGFYVNVHNAANPNGAIRGQLTKKP